MVIFECYQRLPDNYLTFIRSFPFNLLSFVKDKKSAQMVLGIKGHNAYCSCWHCLIQGEKLGRRATHFPFSFGDQFPPRTDEFVEYCLGERAKCDYEDYGGHKYPSYINFLPTFNVPVCYFLIFFQTMLLSYFF